MELVRKDASRDSVARYYLGSLAGGARLCLRTSPLLVVSFAWLHESEDLMLHPTYFVCDIFVHNRVFFVSYFLVSCGYHLVL